MNPVDNAIGWPLQTGQDWLPNHAVDAIDFASIHMWPDNWLRTDLTFGKNWIAAHEEARPLPHSRIANLSTAKLKTLVSVETVSEG